MNMMLPNKKYKIIYADPPWQFNNKNTGGSLLSGSANHYDVMTLDDICNLPVKDIADDDCILFMWWVASQPQEALKVVESWGFTLKTMTGFNWVKETKNGKDFFGMGFWTRQASENCLIAVKGKPQKISSSVRAVTRAKVGEHSEKPNIFNDKIIELMGDIPRIELFARNRVDGWDSWGLELESKPKIVASMGGGFTSSAQMPRLLIEKYGKENIEFINCVLPNESPDTWKLFDAVEERLGITITYIAYDVNNKWQYVDKKDRNNSDLLDSPFDIFDRKGFIGNSRNDPCSSLLKRETVYNYVSSKYKPEDIVIAVGIHGDEFERREAIEANWKRNGYTTIFPIIEEPYIPKEKQIELLKEWYGVSLELYEYGFEHNNCGGACVKAGQRQWAMLWYYKPDVYNEWEQRELKWNEMWAKERGKEYTILKIQRNGQRQYVSLKDFREQILEPAYRGESNTFLSKFVQTLVPNPGCMWCSSI